MDASDYNNIGNSRHQLQSKYNYRVQLTFREDSGKVVQTENGFGEVTGKFCVNKHRNTLFGRYWRSVETEQIENAGKHQHKHEEKPNGSEETHTRQYALVRVRLSESEYTYANE